MIELEANFYLINFDNFSSYIFTFLFSTKFNYANYENKYQLIFVK
jgi:hypothetical protein